MWSGLTIVWAQASPTTANALVPMALRRWFASLTLSSPEAVPSQFGLWLWLGGLAALALVVFAFQGPVRALRQMLDLPGLLRLVGDAFRRLKRAWRVVAVTIGLTVVSWTAGQIRTYSAAQGRDDLVLLTKSRGLGELAIEQGALAALTPFRDVAGLADNLPLLILAIVVLFRLTIERWGGPYVPLSLRPARRSAWEEVVWGVGALYVVYRIVSIVSDTGGLPLGGCIVLETLAIPAAMALLDGALLAWVLLELRNASLGDTGNDTLDTEQAARLVPGAVLTCLTALPARYLATAVALLSLHLPKSGVPVFLQNYLRWQANWGLAETQAASLVFAGLAGAVAWTRGSARGALRGYGRLLATEGGHLAALVAAAGVTAGGLSALAYVLVLSLPVQTWVLAAADGYAHYGTLPVGLVTLAALVELGERSLPAAALASEPAPAQAGEEPAVV